MTTFSSALTLQGRVLWALCLREIHGKHGKSRMGYLWQLVKTAFGVAVFWWIRAITGFASPDMPLPVFLLLGFIPWYLFSSSLSMTMEAVRTNKALLTFPQITPLDLCLSSAIVVWCTEIVVFGIYWAGLSLTGYAIAISDPMSFILGFLGAALLGLGLGLTLAAFNLYMPVIEKLVPMVMRILFFTSGVFFSPVQLSQRFGSDAVMWLPTANLIEIIRNAAVSRDPSEYVKLEYTVSFVAIALVLGLLLERHVRPFQERAQ